jgi:tetraacyldisaccharide 4'-kinase
MHMDEAALHDLLSGRRRDVGAMLLRSGLHLASWAYAAVTRLRNRAYDWQCLSVKKAEVPVISLGNLTTGGTGKTPLAAWLANRLVADGLRPGLLSRGYRSLDPSQVDGSRVGNDEKMVLDRLCPGVPHRQQKDRVSAARRLVSEFGCNVLILDDGFQHRRLHRDLNLLLIDALQPWGYGHVLPRGLLREPRSGIRRADLVLITRADQVAPDDLSNLKRELAAVLRSDECVEVAFVPQRLVGLDGTTRPLGSLAGQTTAAFCGIGNPQGFRQTLASLGVVCNLRAFADHHHYVEHEIAALSAAAQADSAQIVLTTLKDLVKIAPESWTGPPLYAVEIGVEFLSGAELLKARIQQLVISVGDAR